MVPIFMEFDDHKFIADLMAELDVYARASGTLEAYMTERILPLAWQASARRWWVLQTPFPYLEAFCCSFQEEPWY